MNNAWGPYFTQVGNVVSSTSNKVEANATTADLNLTHGVTKGGTNQHGPYFKTV